MALDCYSHSSSIITGQKTASRGTDNNTCVIVKVGASTPVQIVQIEKVKGGTFLYGII